VAEPLAKVFDLHRRLGHHPVVVEILQEHPVVFGGFRKSLLVLDQTFIYN
jgi:hypothetical protein